MDGTLEVDGVEWRAVEEGFRSLDKDLNKLQVQFGTHMTSQNGTNLIHSFCSNLLSSMLPGFAKSSRNGTNDPNPGPKSSISLDKSKFSLASIARFAYLHCYL